MPKRLNFEEVPLEAVKKLVEEQLQQEVGKKRQEEKTTGSGPEIKRKTWSGRNNSFGGLQAQSERQEVMTHTLDVFRFENDGVRWLESAASFECAKARIQELALRSPGVFGFEPNNRKQTRHQVRRRGGAERSH